MNEIWRRRIETLLGLWLVPASLWTSPAHAALPDLDEANRAKRPDPLVFDNLWERGELQRYAAHRSHSSHSSHSSHYSSSGGGYSPTPAPPRYTPPLSSGGTETQAPPTSGALGSQTPRYFSSPSDQSQGGAPAPTAIRKPTAVELEEMIRTVQMALMARGYDILGINGKLDAVTKMALKQYQEDSGYPVTGRMDARTLASLGIVGQ